MVLPALLPADISKLQRHDFLDSRVEVAVKPSRSPAAHQSPSTRNEGLRQVASAASDRQQLEITSTT